MQELVGIKDLIDLTEDSIEEISPKEKVLDLEDGTNDSKIKTEPEIYKEKGEKSGLELNGSRSFRNFDKSLDKAVEEIKKGGSLISVANRYQISEDVLYTKLISRTLPRETDVLTMTEENNLVKWILKSNHKNSLVFKYQLLEKVGRLKKICKITPIFSKSKFGRMWYDYFLESHPEIYENEGLLMPSSDNDQKYKQSLSHWPDQEDIKLAQETFNNTPIKIKQEDPTELLLSLGIKEAVVVLHDFRKQEASLLRLKEEENISNDKELNYKADSTEDAVCDKNDQFQPKQDDLDVKSEHDELEYIEANVSDFSDSDLLKEKHESENDPFPPTFAKTNPFQPKQNDLDVKSDRDELKHIEISEFSDSDVLKERKESNKNNFKPVCKQCNRAFYSKRKLKLHMFTHVPKELYTITCDKCPKTFPSKYHFSVHFKLSHGNTTYYKCKECNTNFKHQTSLMNHKRNVHFHLMQSGNLDFICEMCGKSFKWKNNLVDHIINSHSKLAKSNFICDMCGKSFKYKNSLEAHIVYGHLKLEKKFSCDICHRLFIKHSLMLRHRLRHSKKKPLSCLHCTKTFTRKYLLRAHIQSCFMNEKRKIEKKCEQISKIKKECDDISKEYLEGIDLD